MEIGVREAAKQLVQMCAARDLPMLRVPGSKLSE